MPRKKKPKDKVPLRQQHIGQYYVVERPNPWPNSTVDEHATILRTAGCEKYALDWEDIEHISCTEIKWMDRKTGQPRRGFEYLERDLERQARVKYTSLESLERARRRRAQKKPNLVKRSSSSQTPSASISPPSKPNEAGADCDSDCDKEMQQVDTLDDMAGYLERVGKGWLWGVLNATVRHVYVLESALRSEVILAAQGPFVSRYPVRQRMEYVGPSLTMRPLPESFANLYKIMDDAFMPNNHVTHKLNRPGSDEIISKDWTEHYYNRVYWALVTITDVCGPNGWKEARWVVYDKYTECKLGCVYVAPNALGNWEWGDSAAFWLHRAEYKMGPLLKGRFLELLNQEK